MAGDILYQGGKFDQRTYDMLMELKRLLPFDIFVSQGGFNVGGVAASAGTHDRAAVDISASLLTTTERGLLDRNGRRIGFAGWIRTPAQGFAWHWHGVPIDGDLSTAARAQVVSYYDGKNGLAGGGPDDGTRDYVGVTWEKYKTGSAYRPPINTGGGTTQSKDWFDMATQAEIETAFRNASLAVNRGEGISGTGDRSKNGVGENTVAVHEMTTALANGQSSLLAEQRKTNDLLSKLLVKLGA